MLVKYRIEGYMPFRDYRVRDIKNKIIQEHLIVRYERDKDKNGKIRGRWRLRCLKCNREKLSYPNHVYKEMISCRCNRKKGKDHPGWRGYKEIGKHVFEKIRRQAKVGNRDYEFKITIEDIWDLYLKQNRKCALSGIELRFPTLVSSNDGTASLDRIDNNNGYTKDNIQWVHKHINQMKNNFPQSYFIDLCKLVTERIKNV